MCVCVRACVCVCVCVCVCLCVYGCNFSIFKKPLTYLQAHKMIVAEQAFEGLVPRRTIVILN